jgi:serine/threonine-protein kinase HipA
MAYVPVSVLEVRAWGQTVGAVSSGPQGYLFEYAPAWKRSGVELNPLLMPTDDRRSVFSFPTLNRETFYGLPPMLADALPDKFGNALVDASLAAQGIDRNQITPLDRLAYLGNRGMGALEFVPDNGPSDPRQTALDIGELVTAARSILSGTLSSDTETRSALSQIISVGTSAGGARPKAIVNINEATGEIRPGHALPAEGEEAWLLKFDGVGIDRQLGESQKYTRIEYAYSLMMRAAGITMAPTQLLHENGRAHFLTKRFDRVGPSRIHLQSLCGLNAVDFNLRETNDYAQLFTAAKALQLGEGASTEIFRRMVFNIAASNHDDHSKNHSFMLGEKESWQLSPAYDVTFAHDAESIWLDKHLMGVNGVFANITRKDVLAVADRFAVPNALRAIKDVEDALLSWSEFAAQAELSTDVASTVSSQFVSLKR